MANGHSGEIDPATSVHRVGGGSVENLRLSPLDREENPPGVSVLLGGTSQAAAAQMRRAFPGSRKWRRSAHTVGSSTVDAIRQAGFDVIPDPTTRFPNHGRLIHPDGSAGFTDEKLIDLASLFHDSEGC
jgi:hypothetical protein